ncbi:MAG: hypothetical protein AAGB04_10830 [Pseudomonadota bacterium]
MQRETNKCGWAVAWVAFVLALSAFDPAIIGLLHAASTTYTFPFSIIVALQSVVLVLLGRTSTTNAQSSAWHAGLQPLLRLRWLRYHADEGRR